MSIAEKLQTIAENEQKVYNSGYNDGYESGYNTGEQRGYDNGKQAEYDVFWDAYQDNGERTGHECAFAGKGWTDTTFNPKYDIKPVSAYSMFYMSGITDLRGILESRGVVLDFSNSTPLSYVFMYSTITRLPIIDTRAAKTLTTLFTDSANLVSIEKLILRDDGESNLLGGFDGCLALEDLVIEGVLAKNAKFSSCKKLTHDSLMSIINALKDYSGSTSTYTLTLGSTNLAKLTDAEKAIATQKGWTLA